jgi:hypothetical protein
MLRRNVLTTKIKGYPVLSARNSAQQSTTLLHALWKQVQFRSREVLGDGEQAQHSYSGVRSRII